MARPPITPWRVGKLGDFGDVRHEGDGVGCGIHGFPCVHPGIDLAASPGTVVSAPADGWVIISAPVAHPHFAGYGPSIVLLAHDDRDHNDRGFLSVRYSLLAHLDPESLRFIVPYGAFVQRSLSPGKDTVDGTEPKAGGAAATRGWALLDDGTIAKVGRVPFGEDQSYPLLMVKVKEGDPLGEIGSMRHVHWEVRSQPLAGAGSPARLDPKEWLAQHGADVDWRTAPPSPKGKPRGAGIGLLIALGFAAYELLGGKR